MLRYADVKVKEIQVILSELWLNNEYVVVGKVEEIYEWMNERIEE